MSLDQLEHELGDRIRRTLGEALPRLEAEAEQLARMSDVADGAEHVRVVGIVRGGPAAARRRSTPWAVAAAAAGFVAIAAAIGVRGGASDNEPIDPVTSPPTTASPQTEIEPWPDDFAGLVDPLLPEGFRILHAGRWPLMAVAYDDEGVRLEVLVDVGGVGQPVEGRSTDLVTSPDGDIVSGSVMYGLDLVETIPGPPVTAGRAALLSGVLGGVAEAFTGDVRAHILDATYPVMDAAALRSLVDATASDRLGDHVANRQFAADFTFEYIDAGVRYAVTVIRSDDPLPEGMVEVPSGVVTGRAWVNNWQLIVAAAATANESIDRDVVAELITSIEPVLDAWRPPARADVPICDIHELATGESFVAIADRYGVDEADLRAANPDADVNLWLGAPVQIPCPD